MANCLLTLNESDVPRSKYVFVHILTQVIKIYYKYCLCNRMLLIFKEYHIFYKTRILKYCAHLRECKTACRLKAYILVYTTLDYYYSFLKLLLLILSLLARISN